MALRIQLGLHHSPGHTSSLLAKVGKRLILFSVTGRELCRVASMRCTLNDDSRRDLLREVLRSGSSPRRRRCARLSLTQREIQVASLLVRRMTHREIASALGISAHTVRHHTERVLLNAQVNSRRALRRLRARNYRAAAPARGEVGALFPLCEGKATPSIGATQLIHRMETLSIPPTSGLRWSS